MSQHADGQEAPEPVVSVSDAARELVIAARTSEPNPERLALFIEVSGVADGAFIYEMWFQASADASPADVVHHHDDLAVVVTAASIDRVRGATLDAGDAGLVMLNPNKPEQPRPVVPDIPTSDLSSPLELAILEVLETEVNPQIAMHGGRADLVAVDENRNAYVVLSGGCQGCGLAQVTLSQGIAVAIKDAVPEIAEIIDVTAHADGSDPYFAAEKK